MSRHYGGPTGRPAYTYIGGGGLTPAVKALIIANAAVFVLQSLDNIAGGMGFFASFGLRPADVTGRFFFWQLFTYQFLHGNSFHILMNMLILWMFGCEVERTWNSREFLKFYFVCGVGSDRRETAL